MFEKLSLTTIDVGKNTTLQKYMFGKGRPYKNRCLKKSTLRFPCKFQTCSYVFHINFKLALTFPTWIWSLPLRFPYKFQACSYVFHINCKTTGWAKSPPRAPGSDWRGYRPPQTPPGASQHTELAAGGFAASGRPAQDCPPHPPPHPPAKRRAPKVLYM